MSEGGTRRRRCRSFTVLTLLTLIVLAVSTAWLVRRPEFAGPPVPDPNGYETLLAAGRLVTGVAPTQELDSVIEGELRAFVAANEKALALAQAGFEQESVVPLGRMDLLQTPLEESGPFRQLARVLNCRTVLARREGRISEAMQANVSLLRLSRAVSHGGLLLAQSIGAAIQRPAIQELEGPLLPKLSSTDARRVIAELERLERDCEPVKLVADRDLAFGLSRQSWPMRVAYMINRKTMNGLLAPAIKATESAERRSQSRIRLLLARLALHAYALDHPEEPQPGDLQSLVPTYLSEVPLAPEGERRLTLDDLKLEPETTEESLKER